MFASPTERHPNLKPVCHSASARLHSPMADLNRRSLVVAIANETGMVQSEVQDIVRRALDKITNALARGRSVSLQGFGSFEVRVAAARIARNPRDPAAAVPIPPRAVVRFHPAEALREAVEKLPLRAGPKGALRILPPR